jgi:hypothetical protein
MVTTLYDIIDTWTMKWDRAIIEITLDQVAKQFYKHKLVFFLLEEIWDILELVDDPLEFMTEARKIQQIEKLLSPELNERAAKSVMVEMFESPNLEIKVLNVEELINEHPDWFEPWEGMTLSDFGAKLLEDDK